MADDELLGLYWTTSGPAEPHYGREWSLFDLEDRCSQAARVGFSGIGLWHADLEHILETRTLGEIAQLLDEHGLRHLELEFLSHWFLEPGDERRAASDRLRERLWEAAAALPAHHVKVGNIPGTPCDPDTLTERFAELCADAAEHHDARIVYEFMPPDVNVHDLDTALALVEGANAPNGSLAIDTWHMAKLGIAPDALGATPARHLGWVELSDGQWEDMDDPVDETINHRELPGEGEFPIREYVAAVRDAGYPGPWGVEVLSEKLRALPIEAIFDRAYTTSMAQLSGARHRLTLARLLTETARRLPDRPALTYDERRLTYAELDALAACAAGGLRERGVGCRATAIAFVLPNRPQSVAAYHGALRLGATVVPLNPLLSEREVAMRLEDAGAALFEVGRPRRPTGRDGAGPRRRRRRGDPLHVGDDRRPETDRAHPGRASPERRLPRARRSRPTRGRRDVRRSARCRTFSA